MFCKTVSRVVVAGLLLGATALPSLAEDKMSGGMMKNDKMAMKTGGKMMGNKMSGKMSGMSGDKMMMNKMMMGMSAADKKTMMGMSMAEKKVVMKMMKTHGGMGHKMGGKMMDSKMMGSKMSGKM